MLKPDFVRGRAFHPIGICALLMAFFGAACQHSFEEKDVANKQPPVLRSDTRVFIARPFDVTFKETVMYNSGKRVADALMFAFNRNTRSVNTSRRPESVPEALESARAYRADYLIYPVILKWEDRLTEYSGRRDRLTLRLDIIEPGTGTIVFSREIEAKSRWMTDGGDTPGDLLQQPIDHFVQSLFHTIEKPSALR